MKGVEPTHLHMIIYQSIYELFTTIWNEILTVFSNESQQAWLLYFLEFFGNVYYEIGQGLNLFLSVLEVFHVLNMKKNT